MSADARQALSLNFYMDEQEKMKNSLLRNLNWFLNSGVMIPESGIWGVAERVAVTNGNEAIEVMKKSFPAWMPKSKIHLLFSQYHVK